MPGSSDTLTGALLATGEYQRDWPASEYHEFGSPTREGAWRAVLVARGDREILARAREVLASFLDTLAASPDQAGEFWHCHRLSRLGGDAFPQIGAIVSHIDPRHRVIPLVEFDS